MTPDPRKKTAKELADELGVSVSTVTRRYAEPRSEYLARARAREDEALALKAQNLSDKEVAERLGKSYYATIGLIKRARKRKAAEDAAVAGTD
jgi:DNA-binding CsgD family transcriptional regulator